MTGKNQRIPSSEAIKLQIQIWIDWLFFPVVGLLTILFFKVIHRSRIYRHEEIRKRYLELTADGKPTILCSNHLTMFDSIFLHYAMGSVFRYFFNFRLFAWNVPAVENFKSTAFLSLLTYLGKTIPIDRQGASEHHKLVLNKIRYLLDRGETCNIFPEGGRSRTGRVDVENVTYGVGNILREMEDYQVICVYMRANRQETYSALPPSGDDLYVEMEAFQPETEFTGRRAARDLSVQIIEKLQQMETRYFDWKSRN